MSIIHDDSLGTLSDRRLPGYPRVLIFRAYPVPLSPDSYNCQEIGLADYLESRGFSVDIAAAVESPGKPTKNLPGGRCWRKLRFRSLHPSLSMVANLDELDLSVYPVIIVSDLHIPGNLQLMFRLPRGAGVLVYQGHYAEPYGKGRYLRRIQSRLTAMALKRHNYRLLAKNGAAAALAVECGLKDPRVVGVGLDCEKFANPRELPKDVAEFLDTSPFTYLYVGAIDPRRPVSWALDQLRQPELDGARVLVVGKGPDLSQLKAGAADLVDAGRILFVSRMDQSCLANVYRRVHALLLPTRYEIYGMVALEALYFGLPVVASDAAGPAVLAARFPGRVHIVPSDGGKEAWARAMADIRSEIVAHSDHEPGRTEDYDWSSPGLAFEEAILELAGKWERNPTKGSH